MLNMSGHFLFKCYLGKIQFIISFLLILIAVTISLAEKSREGWFSGFSFSFLPTHEPSDFSYYEIQGVYLNNLVDHKDIIRLMAGFGGAMGLLRHKSEISFFINAKFEIGPSFYKDIFMIVLSTGPAIFTRHRFSNHDFGGPLSFFSSVGLNIIPFWKICIAYRLQHMSNANLFRTNHRLNLHIIELNYLF